MPRRRQMAAPSPVSEWAFEVTSQQRPQPPVAKSTALLWKMWNSPVAISMATMPRIVIVDPDQVDDMEFIIKIDVVFDALLVERLQDHVAGAVSGVTGAVNRPGPFRCWYGHQNGAAKCGHFRSGQRVIPCVPVR